MPDSECKTIVVGVGNTTRTDDGAGVRAVEALGSCAGLEAVALTTVSSGGLRLMEELVGFDRAIVVDAMQSGQVPIGTVATLRIADVSGSLHQASVHDMTLPAALDVGRAAGLHLPHDVVVLGIEVADVTTFGEHLTPEVDAALPEIVRQTLGLIDPQAVLSSSEMEPTPCA